MRRAAALATTIGLLVAVAACSSSSPTAVTSSRPPVVGPAGSSTTSIARSSTTADSTVAPTTTTAAPPLREAIVRLVAVGGGLDNPVAFAVRKGDRAWYVAEQYTARVLALSNNGAARVALDLHGNVSTGNEQGLLGIAFSPDGGRLYVDYTDRSGDTHVDEFTMNGGVADAASQRAVLFQKQPFSNHNGGQLAFGPDGMLYIALGDGGLYGDPYRNGQNRNSLLGKILRIDPRASGSSPYSVPSDNPFVNDRSARPEVWMWGLRNPWRFSFDRATGDAWIGDVGQDSYEEVDWARRGVGGINFGWNKREGTHPYQGGTMPLGAVDPVIDYAHSDADGCSITGGFVYRGRRIPALRGAYVYTDFCAGNVLALKARHGRLVEQRSLGIHVEQPTSFGQGNDGELYVLSRGGSIYRLSPG